MSRFARSVATIGRRDLGQRRAGRDDRQADDEIGDASARANPVAAVHQPVGSENQQREPATTSSTWTDQCRSQREAGSRIHERRSSPPGPARATAPRGDGVGDEQGREQRGVETTVWPSSAITQRITEAPIMIGTSCRTSCEDDQRPPIRGTPEDEQHVGRCCCRPRCPRRFALPWSTPPTETAVSGALVPKATTVRPTTSGRCRRRPRAWRRPGPAARRPRRGPISRDEKTSHGAGFGGRAPARQPREYRCRAGGRGRAPVQVRQGRYST